MAKLTLGSYVRVNKDKRILVAVSYDGKKVKALDPLTNKKYMFNRTSLTALPMQCKFSKSRFGNYMVTLKGLIISLKTFRVMKWSVNDSTEYKTIIEALN